MRNPITSEEFLNRISGVGNASVINAQIGQGLSLITFNPKYLEVKDCDFVGGVSFDSVNLNCGIKFYNCVFNSNLSFNSCIANNYDQEFNFDGYHIEFNNVTIKGGLFFNGSNNIERGIRIYNNSIITKLLINGLTIKAGSFSIFSSQINDVFDVSNCNFSDAFKIREKCTIDTNVRLNNNELSSYTFTESIFQGDVFIWAGIVNSIIFNDGEFSEDFKIESVQIKDNLTIIGANFKKSLKFQISDEVNPQIGSIKKLFIKSGKFGDQFVLNGNNSTISESNLIFSKQLEGSIYFNSFNFINANISGENYSTNAIFNFCNFNKLSFDFFANYSNLQLISIKAFENNSEIILNHSNLGATQFYNFFFDTFDKISIYNSIVTDIIPVNVKWFSEEKLNPEIKKRESYDFVQLKEIYRQIKHALEKNGNRIESLSFKSREMKAYKDELFSGKSRFTKMFGINRFILWVGQTNDFGQNWLKPILMVISIGLLLYIPIIVGISNRITFSPDFTVSSLKLTVFELYNHINILPQLMNPLHDLTKLFPDVKIGFVPLFIDYFFKICLAFFIFQIVSAFRKFIK